jgi:hypothetical protein
MHRVLSRRPSAAMVVAVVALFVALGGTALALTRNSVGADELKGVQTLTTTGTLAPGQSADIDRNCNGGQQLVGGGVVVDAQTTAVQVESSHAKADGVGWEATVASSSAAPHDITVQALCLKK